MIRRVTALLLSLALIATGPLQSFAAAARSGKIAVVAPQFANGMSPLVAITPTLNQAPIGLTPVPTLTLGQTAIGVTPLVAPAVMVSPIVVAAPTPVVAAGFITEAAASVAPQEAKPTAFGQLSQASPFGAARDSGVSIPDQDNLPVPPADAPNSLAQASLELDPLVKYMPSPKDWRDEVFYFAMIDRFARSKQGQATGDPKSGGSRHGGDLKGIIEQLDYIKASGATTIMLNPVQMNLPDSYHGYAPIHLMAIDPGIGTMDDFKTLVRESHARGIKVVMDWVINHSGPVFEYTEGSTWRGLGGAPKEIGQWTFPLKPVELGRDENFTRRGVIDNWNDPEQSVNGDFPPNYRHYASDRKETRDVLMHITKWWMKETDIDGVRLDAIRHLPVGTLPLMTAEIREFAVKLGKDNFFILGENSTGNDWEIVPFMGKNGIDSAYNYPAYRRENAALHGRAPTSLLEKSLDTLKTAFGAATGQLLRFIDNHDTYRYLRDSEPASILKMAMGYLLFSTGIPLVYYGTEQAFRQDVDSMEPEGPKAPADPHNREDMFEDGLFKSASSAGFKFDQGSEAFKTMQRFAQVRRDNPALRRGEQYVRWADPTGAGIYAFSRIYEGKEVLVVLNTSDAPRSAEMWVDSGLTPAGTALKDALDGGYGITAHPKDNGAKVTVEVPPHGVRVLVR